VDSAYADSADTALTADSATSATSAGTASSADDADLLDGMDSAAFAPATAEGWHNVAAAGQAQPAFIRQTCSDSNPFDYSPKVWANYDSRVHNTAAFYKDPFGMVHLKGLIKDGYHFDDGTDIDGLTCGMISSCRRDIVRRSARSSRP
jgi:hypothetical protein